MSEDAFAGLSFGVDSKKVFEYRNAAMCSQWKDCDFNYDICNIKVKQNPYGDIVINGLMKAQLLLMAMYGGVYVKFWAPAKPTRGYSFPGSGIPYPNEAIAYQNTTNLGVVELIRGSFEFIVNRPGSYYKDLGKTLVKPEIRFQFSDLNNNPLSGIYSIPVGEGVAFRTQSWTPKRDWNIGPMFFKANLPIRSQEQILRDSAYTLEEPANFWGLTPRPS